MNGRQKRAGSATLRGTGGTVWMTKHERRGSRATKRKAIRLGHGTQSLWGEGYMDAGRVAHASAI